MILCAITGFGAGYGFRTGNIALGIICSILLICCIYGTAREWGA